jgi:Ca-activated chloride channel family protein
VVIDPSQASAVADKLRAYIERPVLTDIKLDFHGFKAYDVEPTAIPDLLADRPVIVYGKWSGDVGGSVTVSGVSGRGAYRQGIGITTAQIHANHRPLAYLWARSRIAQLSDFNFGRDVEEEVRKEIVDLGLTYNLLTRYTSFLAVHERVRNPSGASQDVKQPLPLPVGVSDAALGEDIETGAEPELVILVAMAMAWIALVMRRRRASVS